MIDRLQPYPKMKNTHVPWFNQVPAHWSVERLKNIVDLRVSNVDKHAKEGEQPVRLCNYVDVYKNDRIYGGMAFMRATATREECDRFRLLPNDVVITKDSESWTDIGVPSLVAEAPADLVCGYHLAILRPAGPDTNPRILGPYLFRVLQCAGVRYQMHVEAHGVTRFGLSNASIGHLNFPVPPPDEQAAIVHYLNHADRRIRRYIAAKQKLIKLLEEQKQAIIHQAVTRGLDPDVPMKDSGISWVGEIPAHWKLERIKSVCSIVRGRFTYRPRNHPSLYGGRHKFIQTGAIARAGKVILSHTQTLSELGLAVSKLFPEGTLVMAIAANIGDVAILGFDCCFPDSVIALFERAGTDKNYLYYVLLAMRSELRREAPVSTQANLNTDRIGGFQIPIPPTDEQFQIATTIEQQTLAVGLAQERSQREITLLQELRTRLIADVVTGQLDVRAAAAALPELPDEDAPEDGLGLDEGLGEDDNEEATEEVE